MRIQFICVFYLVISSPYISPKKPTLLFTVWQQPLDHLYSSASSSRQDFSNLVLHQFGIQDFPSLVPYQFDIRSPNFPLFIIHIRLLHHQKIWLPNTELSSKFEALSKDNEATKADVAMLKDQVQKINKKFNKFDTWK